MFALLAATLDEIDVAKDFLSAAKTSVIGCEIKREKPYPSIDAKRISFSGGPEQQFQVIIQPGDFVMGATNGGVTWRLAKKVDQSRRLLTEREARKVLTDWAKRWPVPKGHVETNFTYRDAYGNSSLTFDRKVAGYWLQAPVRYSIDTRSGEFESYSAAKVRTVTNKLVLTEAQALAQAKKLIGPQIAKFGAHKVKSTTEFLRLNQQGDLTLGYNFWFMSTEKPPRSRSYTATRVFFDGSRASSSASPKKSITSKLGSG